MKATHLIDIGLVDNNYKPLKLGYKVEINNSCDVMDDDLVEKFDGIVWFECGAFGVATEDTIPDFFNSKSDNFITFYELMNVLELTQYDDLCYYIYIEEESNANNYLNTTVD